MTAFTPAPADPPANVDIPSRKTDSQDAFDDKTDTYMGWLSRFRTWLAEFRVWLITARSEVNALGDTAVNAAATATNQADLAMGYRNTAGNHATAAGQSKDAAANSAETATQQAALADTARHLAQQARDTTLDAAGAVAQAKQETQAARDQAQIFATQQLRATSASSLTPSAGNKTFAVETSRSFVAGMYLIATSAGSPANKMSGYVVSYDVATGALTLLIDAYDGIAARADWVIGVAVPASINLQSMYRGAYLRETNNGTLIANKRYGIWTGGGAIAMNMPTLANCTAGDEIVLANALTTWGTNAFTVNCPANVIFKKDDGNSDSTLVCDTNAVQSITLFCAWHDGTQAHWVIE